MEDVAARMRIEFYPDGAVSRNGQPGFMGLGVVAEWKGGRREFSERVYADRATNNRAELLTILLELEKIKPERLRQAVVIIYSDSEWSVKSLRGEYHAQANTDLLARTQALLAQAASAEVVWIRGHNGHPQNERANALAQAAAREDAGRGPARRAARGEGREEHP